MPCLYFTAVIRDKKYEGCFFKKQTKYKKIKKFAKPE